MNAKTRRLIDGQAQDSLEQCPDSFFYHGNSVFTTLLAFDKKPQWVAEHLQRLRSHAIELGFQFPGDNAFLQDLSRILEDGFFRVRLSVGENVRVVEAAPFTPPAEECYRGVKAIVTTIQIHPNLAHLKTGNYLPYRLAQIEAHRQGAFEGLLTNQDGHVVDGSRTSPLLYNNRVLTILTGGLDGITRRMVVEKAKTMGVEIHSARRSPSQLEGQLLLAGTGVGLIPVGPVVDDIVGELINRFRLTRSCLLRHQKDLE